MPPCEGVPLSSFSKLELEAKRAVSDSSRQKKVCGGKHELGGSSSGSSHAPSDNKSHNTQESIQAQYIPLAPVIQLQRFKIPPVSLSSSQSWQPHYIFDLSPSHSNTAPPVSPPS
jgi:hypothetical protein